MHADDIFRGIGKFAVKFRWVVLIVWIAAAVAIPKALPSLASVTQGNNSAFLPASAPSEHATNLAAPLGISLSVTPVPVVAAVSTGSFSTADQTFLGTLVTDLGKVPTVTKVRELGESAVPGPNGVAGQAAQIQVLSNVSQSDQGAMTDLVKNLRSSITAAGPPAGMQVHLAGQLAINVDQQKQSGNTGNQVQGAAFVFILILLFLIFRSVLAPFITVIPALLSVTIAGPIIGELGNHGLKVSSLSQLLLIVLVLGAGTDYGLFLVFRVRENMRNGQANHDAVVNALTKVGESITFSALTVIAALLSLLAATFQIYSQLGIPLAIGIGVMLLAGLTLLPALLAIFGKAAFWPSKPKAGAATDRHLGPGRRRGSSSGPAAALLIGVIVFGALSVAVTAYQSAGFGGTISAPAGTDSAAGTDLMNKYFPVTAANPTNLVYKLSTPAWDSAPAIAAATTQLQKEPVFTGRDRAAQPDRRHRLHARRVHAAARAARLGDAARHGAAGACRGRPGRDHGHPVGAGVPAVPGDVAVRVGGRQDDPVRDVAHGGRPVHHGGAQRGSRGPDGGAGGGAHAARDRLRRDRRGTRAVRHQLDLQQRPGARHPDRDHRHRGAARAGHAVAGRAALPDRVRGALLLRRARARGASSSSSSAGPAASPSSCRSCCLSSCSRSARITTSS